MAVSIVRDWKSWPGHATILGLVFSRNGQICMVPIANGVAVGSSMSVMTMTISCDAHIAVASVLGQPATQVHLLRDDMIGVSRQDRRAFRRSRLLRVIDPALEGHRSVGGGSGPSRRGVPLHR